MRRPSLICLLLMLVTTAVFWPVFHHDFINFDDGQYVTENPHVLAGLKWEEVRWALVSAHSFNWHPLTWLSHMLDCQLFGLSPGWHHFHNVLLHVLNSGLLFFICRRLTRALWTSAFVAGLFALHPMHVESVAWVAERKDVLSTLFFLLTIWAYSVWVEKSASQSRLRYYLLALTFFTLGLMSKSMLVTLPFVLLLLDYWPLRRWDQSSIAKSFWPLVREKLPFFALSAMACVTTVWAQRSGGSIILLSELSPLNRISNALTAYWLYIMKLCWPSHLAVYYPFRLRPLWQAAIAGIGLIILTVAFLRRRTLPFLTVGWLWFLGTLVPVIGLVQIGTQAMADRYTYIPGIGLFLIVAFGLREIITRLPGSKLPLTAVAIAALATLTVVTSHQIATWKNNETLYTHAINVTHGNYVAYNNLGTALEASGRVDEAQAHYRFALDFRPDHPEANYNLARVLMAKGKLDEALPYLQQSLKARSARPTSYALLGNLLLRQGKADEALAQFQKSLSLDPDLPEANSAIGCLLASQGHSAEAIKYFETAVRSRPNFVEALNNLGAMLTDTGRPEAALKPLTNAIQIKADFSDAHYNLANALVALKRSDDAQREYQVTLRLKPDHDQAHYKLGNLLLARSDTTGAIEQYRAATTANPNFAEAHYMLATLVITRRDTEAALKHFREAVKLKPDWIEALNNLAWTLATQPEERFRNGPEALKLAARAVMLTRTNDVEALDTLAAAYAESGQFSEASSTAKKAVSLIGPSGDSHLRNEIQKRIALYELQTPFRDASSQ